MEVRWNSFVSVERRRKKRPNQVLRKKKGTPAGVPFFMLLLDNPEAHRFSVNIYLEDIGA